MSKTSIWNLFLSLILLAGCGSKSGDETAENPVGKLAGYWQSADHSEEVFKISENGDLYDVSREPEFPTRFGTFRLAKNGEYRLAISLEQLEADGFFEGMDFDDAEYYKDEFKLLEMGESSISVKLGKNGKILYLTFGERESDGTLGEETEVYHRISEEEYNALKAEWATTALPLTSVDILFSHVEGQWELRSVKGASSSHLLKIISMTISRETYAPGTVGSVVMNYADHSELFPLSGEQDLVQIGPRRFLVSYNPLLDEQYGRGNYLRLLEITEDREQLDVFVFERVKN